MTIREGAMLRDRWRIDRKIGRGSMATVWAATHRNGDRVAIKVLHPELVQEGTVKQRFLREAYVANAVSHPGVVRVIDDDALPDGAPFLVMDLLVGETLEAHRKKRGGKLPVEEAARILEQLLDILDAAHKKNIVHRDLKPENLFIESDGRVRILDFGLARLLEGSDFATRTGALLGTPEFMAPEQAAGKSADIDARTDLWSVGATGFLLFSGQNVYDAHNVAALINAILSKPPRRLETVAPDVPLAIAQVIDGALVRDRGQRWQTAAEMRDAMRSARGARAELENADTVSARDSEQLPEPVTNKLERAVDHDAKTTLREAAPATPPSPPTLVSERERPKLETELETATMPNARAIVSETEAMPHAPVRRIELTPMASTGPNLPLPRVDAMASTGPNLPLPSSELTPVPAPVPRPFAETRLQPIKAPEPPRAPAPPPPPKAMSLFVLLAIAGLFAILVMAIVIALK